VGPSLGQKKMTGEGVASDGKHARKESSYDPQKALCGHRGGKREVKRGEKESRRGWEWQFESGVE